MSRRPVIGITTYELTGSPTGFYLPRNYVEGVRRAGGLPILLPPGGDDLEQVLGMVDGVLLSGGGDIHPRQYGGRDHPTMMRVSEERDDFELGLTNAVLARDDRPLFCICRGLQVLNVACGGSLHADVPEAFGDRVIHRDPERNPVRHATRVEPDSRLGEIVGLSSFEVSSRHHQAANEVGRGLRPVAWSEDGVIEGLEHPEHPFCVGVQWHPELTLDDALTRRLFEAFIHACSPHRPSTGEEVVRRTDA